MTEPQASSERPPRGPAPPAPPAPGDPPGRGPDPSDPGPPIAVQLDDLLLGDLGNVRVDARLLRAVLLRDGRMAEWLRTRGIDDDAVEEAFPGTGWPLY